MTLMDTRLTAKSLGIDSESMRILHRWIPLATMRSWSQGVELLNTCGSTSDCWTSSVTLLRPRNLLPPICHGPQILAAAGVLTGKHCSCYPAVRYEVSSTGGTYVEPSSGFDSAHTDGNLVSAPAWPAHPAWISQFAKLLGSKIEA